MLVPKLLLTPIKIRIFGPKTAKFGPKFAFLVILGQILSFLAHLVPCPTKKQCEQGAQVFSRYVGIKTFAFSSKNQDFCPRTTKIGSLGHFGPNICLSGPFWCYARPKKQWERGAQLVFWDVWPTNGHFSLSKKIRIWPKFGPKYACLVILGQILAYLIIWCHP